MLDNGLIPIIFCVVDSLSNKQKELLLNISEKVVRGLANLFPQGSALEKIFFSYKDAQNEVKTKDSLDKLNSNTNKLLEILSEKPSKEDQDIISKLMEKLFANLKYNIGRLKNDIALKDIIMIKQSEGYKRISQIQRFELLSFEAEIYIKNNSFEVADALVKELTVSEVISERICNFILYYASIKDDRCLFDKYYNIYAQIAPGKKIILKKAFWGYIRKEYDAVIDVLCNKIENRYYIKNELNETSDAYFFWGLSLFEKKMYVEAAAIFGTAYEKENNPIYLYYQILSKAFKIIDRKSAIVIISSKEEDTLKTLYNDICQQIIIDLLISAPEPVIEEYWIQRISIAMHFDEKLASQDYMSIPERLKNRSNIRQIAADVFYFNNQFNDAATILSILYSETKDVRFLQKLLNSYIQSHKYDEILEFRDQIDTFDEEGIMASLLLEAFSKKHSFEETEKYANTLIGHTKHPIYIYRIWGDLYYEKGDINSAEKCYEEMINSITSEDHPVRLALAKQLRMKNMLGLCLICLAPYSKFNYEANKIFVYDAIKINDERFLPLAENIINKHLEDKNELVYWLGCKVDLEYGRNNYNISLKYLKELYSIKPTMQVCYNMARLKMLLGLTDLLDQANLLLSDDNPHNIMMAANCFSFMKDYKKAEYYSLKAIACYGNGFDERLYTQYIAINLSPKPGISDSAELDEVTVDCAVLLSSESFQQWIGITSQSELFVPKCDCVFADTIFYIRNDIEVISFIGMKKGDTAVYKGVNCIIKDVWEIKTKVLRHCLMQYTSIIKDSKFLKVIEIDDTNPLDSMLPFLAEGEIYDKEMLADYNFRNGIGLPLYQIAVRKGRNIADAILFLLENNNQAFYTGEVNYAIKNKQKIILSASSIVILSLLEILEEIICRYNSHVTISKNTKKYFIDIVDKMNTEEYGVWGTLGVEDGKFSVKNYSKESKRTRQEFFNKIILSLNKVENYSIEISPEEQDEKSTYIKLLSLNDCENLKYAGDHNMVLVMDDLFVRKAQGIYNKDVTVINSVSLMYEIIIDDIDLLLDKVELLSKGKYNYLYNVESLTWIFIKLKEKYTLIGKDSTYGRLINIIHNSLSTPITFQDYSNILIRFVDRLFNYAGDPIADYLIDSTIIEIWRYLNIYGLSPEILIRGLSRICYNNAEKTNYFYEILRRLNSGK